MSLLTEPVTGRAELDGCVVDLGAAQAGHGSGDHDGLARERCGGGRLLDFGGDACGDEAA
ncbi:hypothetical protein [Actinophytocola sediminis]